MECVIFKFTFTAAMAKHWLSNCDLGKAIIVISDLMYWPEQRKYNYSLRVYCEPIKISVRRFNDELDRLKKMNCVLENNNNI